MLKNTSGQRFFIRAFNASGAVTGIAGTITCTLSIDGGSYSPLGDTNPTEIGKGKYYFDLTQAETNGTTLDFLPESSTAGIEVLGDPASTIYTSIQSQYSPFA